MSSDNRSGNGTTLAYYLGSKQRMAAELVSHIHDVCSGDKVYDLFSGMGSASVALSAHYDVTAIDVQEYSRVMCSALIEGNQVNYESIADFTAAYEAAQAELLNVYAPAIEYEDKAIAAYVQDGGALLSEIIEHGCLLPEYRSSASGELALVLEEVSNRRLACNAHDAIARYFGGTYFSYKQAVDLSAMRSSLREVDVGLRQVVLAGILCSASHCASTVGGQFAQPLKTTSKNGKPKAAALEKARNTREKDAFSSFKAAIDEIKAVRAPRPNNMVIRAECCDYLESNAPKADAIYADPPYSRYHYSRYYHVLETIAVGDEPRITLNRATGLPSRGIYREGRYQSPFSTRKGARPGFERLIRACVGVAPALVLSYSPFPERKASTPRMVTIDELSSIAKRYYKKVEICVVEGVVHSKLANGKDALAVAENAEVLIVCKN